MARGEVTDTEWALIEPWLPVGERGPIPDLRRQLNGVIYHFRTGSPWRDVPAEYGSWSTVYDRFRAWALAGVMQHLQERMIAEAAARGQVDLSLVSVDSTSQRAHQHAAGMAVNPELLRVLEKAAEEEKGVRARNESRKPQTPKPPKTSKTPSGGKPGGDGVSG